jgi:DNA repair exonuclease SbcCD nuclease subunit
VETEEEWYNTQKKVLEFIYSFKQPVLIAGDIFHHYNPGNRILELFLSFALHHETYIMMGNHDARNGILDPDSGYGVLDRIIKGGHDKLKSVTDIASCIPFGGELQQCAIETNKICLHQLTFPSSTSGPPNTKFVTARDLLSTYPDYNYIIVGDNHSNFLFEKNGRFVLNPGCITKQDVSYKEKDLKIFSITGPLEEIKEYVIPDDGELVDDTYIISTQERDGRYENLIESLKVEESTSFDYKENTTCFLAENSSKLRTGTCSYIKELMYANS